MCDRSTDLFPHRADLTQQQWHSRVKRGQSIAIEIKSILECVDVIDHHSCKRGKTTKIVVLAKRIEESFCKSPLIDFDLTN
jgi:hypothetical protein